MMRLLLVAIVAIVVGVNSQATEVTATFTNAGSGIDGWVKIDNAGNVSLWYNISGANQTKLAMENCMSGHSYHIHDLWSNFGSDTDAFFNCGGANTGLHYDPASACGAASSSVFCSAKGRCLPSSSAGSGTAGDYSANCNGVYNDYLANPYGCEVGDLKGKFGAVNPLTYYNWQDPYMPLVNTLVGKSIVFHCPSGARAFCAQFASSSTTAPTNARKRVDMTAMKKTAESPYGTIEFLGDGSHTISLDVTSIQTELEAISSTCITGGLKYHVHQKWDHTDASYKVGSTDCGAGPTGGHYDPTLGCSGVSDNMYCNNKGGCVNGSSLGMDGTTYSCVGVDADPFKCEVSDLSNMFGNIAFPAGTTMSTAVDTATNSMFGKYQPIMPSLAMLEGKSIVFHCATGGARALCMKIGEPGTGTSGSGTTSTTGAASTTGDIAAASTVAPALLLSFVAFLFAL